MEYHPIANLFPLMDSESFESLKEDIKNNGQIEPIWIHEGQILDGRNRYNACLELGIEPITKTYTGDSPTSFVVSLNIARRHLTSSQLATVAVEIEPALAEEARKRREATQFGSTATQIIAEPEKGEARQKAAEITGTNRQYVSDAKKIKKESPEDYELIKSGVKTIPQYKEEKKVIASLHTGDEESYTPQKYLESARNVLGNIDLDPASNRHVNERVMADIYYSKEDDGLSQSWHGNVWLNPPYTALVINKFIEKLIGHYNAGEVESAIVLTNNNTDTSWFHAGAESCSAICFTRGRINFLKSDGSKSSPTNGQCFFYFGDDIELFNKEFSEHGLVMVKA